MINSTYAPQRWSDLETAKVVPMLVGLQNTATAGGPTNTDWLLTNDILFRSIEVCFLGASAGDTITLQIIDVDGMLGTPNAVLSCPILNWNVFAGTGAIQYVALTPRKALAGLTFRLIYISTGESDVTVGLNYTTVKLAI